MAAAVVGGLALGIPGAAAAQSVGFTVLPSDDGVYPPRPVVVENVQTPTEPVVVSDNQVTQPNNIWPQNNWQGWNWPQAYTNNDTTNSNAQPVVAPAGAGGAGGVMPVQNAVQQAAPEAMPEEEVEEAMPEEETDEEKTSDEDFDEEDFEDEAAGMGPEETMGGGGPAQAAGGPAAGPQLPFTGAPMSVAAAGAGLLAVALGCTLMSARRRRSSGAE
ncbi:hypothetical protein ACWEQG_24470 [Microbispora sp. NPDC004025]